MDKYTSLVLDKNRNIVSILRDELSLFPVKKSMPFKAIFPENSKIALSHFFNEVAAGRHITNWELDVFKSSQLQRVYFSAVVWMDYFLVCISDDEGYNDFLSIEEEQVLKDKALNKILEGDGNVDELNEISRLNNELVEIQRELTKKNLNLELLNKRLEELATTDPLTGIFNRRAVLERVRLEFNRALRENESCGMAILDLDDFKRINDQFGHLMGDEALRITSKCLKDSTREYDVAGRFGGDEFLVFFSVKSLQEFEKILNRLLAEINNHTMDISGELTVRIKASIGGVFIDPGNITGELGINMLMKKADDALYNAKDKGGNNVNIYGKFRGLLI
jgi:diguanylate cyclase (GGDEF)-like protein